MIEIYGGQNGFSPSITRFPAIAGIPQSSTTEAPSQTTFRTPGQVTNLYARIITNPLTGSTTFDLRKNLASATNTISIGAGASGEFEDTTHTDNVLPGDELNYRIVTGTGAASIQTGYLSCKFTSWLGYAIKYVAYDSATIGVSASVFIAIHGGNRASETTEANVQTKTYCDFIMKNMVVYSQTNSRSDATTFRNRINGANGTVAISVGAAQTGLFENTNNIDFISAGYLINYNAQTGAGTGTIQWNVLAGELMSLDKSRYLWVACDAAGTSQADANISYIALAGGTGLHTTQSDVQMKARMNGKLSNLRAYISVNTIAATSTMTVQKNGSDTALTISINASGTGAFEDTTNSVFFVTTDELGLKSATGTSATNTMTIQLIQMQVTGDAVTKQNNNRIRPAAFTPGLAR